uniref:Wsv447-like protein n=1 Tax=Pasiphaea japonica whispovirus TaxID=2984286 RepID=A0A9C7C9U0_9VIRU|nr:MAG: wsv447-like protein [Pasiphaea japonica whispovirus]
MGPKRHSEKHNGGKTSKKTKFTGNSFETNICAYPFAATRSQVWRKIAQDSKSSSLNSWPIHPSAVLKLPDKLEDAKSQLYSVSLQQAIAVRYLRNSIVHSYAGGGISVFHLGGLAGAGKTTMVKELIAELDEAKIIDSSTDEDMLLCCKSNSAIASLMSACKFDEKSLMYNSGVFLTLNKGFAIPVIHNKSEITPVKINYVVNNLCKRVSGGLGNLKFLVVDEYTMAGCREMVFIDAILRIVKLRPDIPFGGVCVIFLGDNRQNSAVVEDNNSGVQFKKQNNIKQNTQDQKSVSEKANNAIEDSDKNVATADDQELEDTSTFETGGVEEENIRNVNEAKLYTEVFTKILKTFCDRSHFGQGAFLKHVINTRIDSLNDKLNQVRVTNNDMIFNFEKSKDGEINNKNLQSEKHHQSDKEIIMCKDEDEDDNIFDDDFNKLLTDENILKIMSENALMSTISNGRVGICQTEHFSQRATKIIKANEHYKQQLHQQERGKKITKNEKCNFNNIIGKLPLSAIIEEGMNAEMDHLIMLRNLNTSEIENHTQNIFTTVFEMAMKAMVEIDYSGREKLYIVSSLSERFSDTHVTSLMDHELLNAKLVLGNDEKCIDAVPFFSSHARNKALAACIRNAFLRDGRDIKEELPISVYFKENIDTVAKFVEYPLLTFECLKAKALEIRIKLLSSFSPSSSCCVGAKKEKPQMRNENSEVDCYDELDDDDYPCGDVDYIEDDLNNISNDEFTVISREDTPKEIAHDLSTNERVGLMVDFHVKWNIWLKQKKPSDVVRARIWYLYLLVRMHQTIFDNGEFPSLDMSSFYGRLFFKSSEWPNLSGEDNEGKTLHEEYWMRALSMPVSSVGDTNQNMLLSAYSSLLSAVSRTYIISSLKRVDVIKHAYSLMYGVSLLDMTVSLPDLIDVRKIFPNTFNEKYVDPMRYFGCIFPSMVSEFLMKRQEDVLNMVKMTESAKGSLKVSKVISNVVKATRNTNFTQKSIVMAMQMLTSISKGNMRHALIQQHYHQKGKKNAEETGNNKDNLTEKISKEVALVVEKGNRNRNMERMMGAITLTKKHSQKNAVSYLVDMSISTQTNHPIGSSSSNIPQNVNAIKATRSDVKFVVKNIDLTYIGYDHMIRQDHRLHIINLIKNLHFNKKSNLFDVLTDSNLLRQSMDSRKFTNILIGVRNKVTRAKSVIIYQGQNVVFTTTNNCVRPIHGAQEKFVTKDTGVVTDINMKNGELTVSVFVERLGSIIHLKEGQHMLGTNNENNINNAYVKYLPFESSQAMTIYSCQGHTFFRDTVVDLSGASTQDAYVAITRNSDPLNLYIVETHTTERKNLSNLKYSMSKDKASLMPIGGLGDLGGDAFVNYDQVNAAYEVLSAMNDYDGDEDNASPLMYSVMDPTKDVVSAAQKFIINRSGNALAFNAVWMANTGKKLQDSGLKSELQSIRNFFFPKEKDSKFADYYEEISHRKIMELYTAVIRSTTHYAIASNLIRRPNNKLLEEYETKHRNKRDYIKIHPSFVNRSPKESTVSNFLYDVAPHSVTMMILQFYIHYLFLVYERLHVCNASFAFLPAPTPMLNQHVRGAATNLGNAMMVPGLAYESKDFISSADGGERDGKMRIPVTATDYVSDNIIGMLSNAESEEKVAEYTDYACKSMLHNLRRTGKFCRPHEACGLSKHGAIVASIDNEDGVQNIHYSKENGWVTMAAEANLYCLLIFMTKLAAASGVTVYTIEDSNFLECNKDNNNSFIHQLVLKCSNLHLKLSNDILWCGQVYPMKRVQFSLHAKRSGSNCDIDSIPKQVFSDQFYKFLFDRKQLYGVKLLAIVEMMGHEFASCLTSDMRMNMYNGVGSVVDILSIDNEEERYSIIISINKFILKNIKDVLFLGGGKRVSFFFSCSVK